MKLHFIGVAGRAMGGIAIALSQAGHEITGSDHAVYEPMRSQLSRAGIAVLPFASANISPQTEAVVVGRRVRDDNPELARAGELGVPVLSFPALLRERFLASSRNVVVAGGVGKTTTTAMTAWVLEVAGRKPDFLIGGLARNFPSSTRLRRSGLAVIEGCEYAAGPGDHSPKFLHYPPEVVIVTNLLADHPDLYPDEACLFDAFARLVETVPAHGCLVLPADDPQAARLAAIARCRVVTVGVDAAASSRITGVQPSSGSTAFRLDGVPVTLPMAGLMNVRNAAMAMAAAAHLGVPYAAGAAALSGFGGLADRQEAIEAGHCVVVRDKASHPASIRELGEALRQKYPGRRLVSVMQPRATGGRHWVYQRDLPDALSGFDLVLLAPPYEHQPPADVPWAQAPFCIETLARELAERNVPVKLVATLADLPERVDCESRPGDIVLLSLREQFAEVGVAVHESLSGRAVSA